MREGGRRRERERVAGSCGRLRGGRAVVVMVEVLGEALGRGVWNGLENVMLYCGCHSR